MSEIVRRVLGCGSVLPRIRIKTDICMSEAPWIAEARFRLFLALAHHLYERSSLDCGSMLPPLLGASQLAHSTALRAYESKQISA